MPPLSIEKPAYFINRETSWLRFNQRVLEEAEDEQNPLLERVKFLSITASNLDEFFEVRVASLLQRIEDGYTVAGPDGLTPEQELELVSRETHEFTEAQYACWNERLRPALAEQGIRILDFSELDTNASDFLEDYCEREVDPLLTPITIDPAHPFPRVVNKALCLAFLLRRRRRASAVYMGVITVPRSLPRVLRVPSSGDTYDYVFLADLVAAHAAKMYRGYEIISAAAFRVTRNSNLYLQEEESRNLLESVRTELHNRRKGDAVRLEIEAEAAPEIVERLRGNFGLEEWQVFRTSGPVNLSRVSSIYEQTQRTDLKYRPFVPRELHLTGKSRDIFEEIRKHDILLHHPFDSFDAVVGFIETAAKDPRVISLRQTLYRTSEESPIVQALIEAAPSKEVTVVVELKARFDEASNIRWARSLEDAGVQVFHGLVGLKTHCKLALLVRRDPDGVIRRYAHLGTGNYNSVTARYYTDLSLLTANEEITEAVQEVFNFLTAYADQPHYDPLLVSPVDCAERTLALIQRETDHARARRPARIIAKMNALLDKPIIQALYRASQAGVGIDLIVRGMCALRPGVRGVSDRIRVRSIVGRLLEHSRIYFFANGGEEEIYLGSADWMPRNLYERVEVVFPVFDPLLRQRVRQEILESYLADTAKARILQASGEYVRAGRVITARRRTLPARFNAQEFLIALATGSKSLAAIPLVPERRRSPRLRDKVEQA
ncbi:MAG TPA: polyphosphate kinase 1 [Terriglobales bacterium]|nr:polyphosphate kinase 1 [Terriglobales bacterium]